MNTTFSNTTKGFNQSLQYITVSLCVWMLSTASFASVHVPASYWEITIQGQSQDATFQRKGYLVATNTLTTAGTSNGVNVIDMAIYSGSPLLSPESGAIAFMSNNGFIGDSLVDLVYITFNQNQGCYIMQPDPNMDVNTFTPNVFNTYSGLLANAYQIYNGYATFCSQDGFKTVTGEINVQGSGAQFTRLPSDYKATFTGIFIGNGTT